jgi:hypothetical protein
MTDINKLLSSSPLKDTFVMPLKQNSDHCAVDEYQYVIGIETEELIFKDDAYYTFSRYYCLLSDYKCIKLFMEVLIEIASTKLIT